MGDAAAPGRPSERVRWIQDCLNHASGSALPVDGLMDAATRSRVRDFQQRNGLRPTGIVGPDTEAALREACRAGAAAPGAPAAEPAGEPAFDAASAADGGAGFDGQAAGGPGGEPAANGDASGGEPAAAGDGQPAEGEFSEYESGIGDLAGRVAGKLGAAVGRVSELIGGCQIVDLTAQSAKDVEKGNRDPKTVYALVLHQMACCFQRRDPMRSYLRVKAHYAILPDGKILYLHPASKLIWASHGFNNRSVAVEFAGNFPDTKGRWWNADEMGRNQVTSAQIKSGRCLIQHLVRTMGLRVVLTHRQSSNMRMNDPGPDIWSQVGQWAVDTLGLSDGGPGFKVGTGSPIPDEWRTWRRGRTPELAFEAQADETASGEQPWRGAPEGETDSELTLAKAIDDRRARGPGIYTLYKNGQRLYVGRATNLRNRLMQHRWCLEQVCDAGRQRSTAAAPKPSYTVKLTPMRGADAAQLKRVESATIARWKRRSEGGPLTNVKARELG
ncbi:MAG: hypothetical protein GX644_06765 [Limnobacter sp.]|nr:hypothetical protein [Limnobacter sp.]